jgi:hypothetical protein
VWKKVSDTIEVISKILSGVASMVAFGASSVKNPVAADWMSFGSGCIGTLSLTLMLFSNYSGKVSRLRTNELNSILRHIGITPVAQITSGQDAEDLEDMETTPRTNKASFNRSLLDIKREEPS